MKIELQDKQPVEGTLEMTIYRKGEPIEHIVEHNIVVNGGRNRLAQLVAGKSTKAVTQIGFGTAGKIPEIADSALTNPFLKNIDSASVSAGDAIFKWSLDETEPPNGLDIREFGLFTGDNVMVTRLVRARVIGKDVDMTIDGTYTLHF